MYFGDLYEYAYNDLFRPINKDDEIKFLIIKTLKRAVLLFQDLIKFLRPSIINFRNFL